MTPYRGSATAQGYGSEWAKKSARVLAEEPWCPGYPPGRHGPELVRTTVVDHVKAKRRGGTDVRENLKAYCRPCHSRKTIAEDGGWGHEPPARGPHTGESSIR